MPFIASLGRRPCNACRKVPPAGETIYQGDITGMTWCLACADKTLHIRPSAEDAPRPARVLPSSWARFGPETRPSWFERGED